MISSTRSFSSCLFFALIFNNILYDPPDILWTYCTPSIFPNFETRDSANDCLHSIITKEVASQTNTMFFTNSTLIMWSEQKMYVLILNVVARSSNIGSRNRANKDFENKELWGSQVRSNNRAYYNVVPFYCKFNILEIVTRVIRLYHKDTILYNVFRDRNTKQD